MDTDKHGLIDADITHSVIGAAMEVLNHLGHGLLEKPYENALVVELNLQGLKVAQQQAFDVLYKEVTVGVFVPDLIVNNEALIDTKVIDRIGNHELGQMLNYLKITGIRTGLIFNFKHPKLEWKRVRL